jgi:ferric-dicitrate binding protein FerR (iron transport regulator)
MKSFSSAFARTTICVLTLALVSCAGNDVRTADNFEMVELPDGSIVYLNHNSSLQYSDDFSPREVRAEGELFFSIEEGDGEFLVKTESGDVKVLGTEFGIKTTEEDLEVDVEEGTVEVSAENFTEKIERGYAAAYRQGDHAIQTTRANFKFRKWMSELKVEFRKIGREFKRSSRHVGKESEKAGKKLKKELKSLKPD